MAKMLQYRDGLYVNTGNISFVTGLSESLHIDGEEVLSRIELQDGCPVYSSKSVEHIVAVINGEEPY